MTTQILCGSRFELSQEDDLFPDALRCIRNPPEKLYGIGNPKALKEGLAIVGARKATPYGLGCAKKFAKIAAQRRITIISGGARGCDAASHRAALEVGGSTVAFLGGGCDEVYPKENFGLFQEIINTGGAVVSENPYEFKPLPFTFRDRNRLIAGLAKATLIVEAGLPSGTFSTADEALAANREVLVVPGSITSSSSLGANRLIYQGATPIIDEDTFGDQLFSIFDELKQEKTDVSEKMDFTAQEQAIFDALLAEPMSTERLLKVAEKESKNTDTTELISWLMLFLMRLQNERLISIYPDGKYGPLITT